uniref:Uncharacterized protein n=1 Tax=Strigamia maritima TaxID=126957 RepID=T1JDU1_STRMM
MTSLRDFWKILCLRRLLGSSDSYLFRSWFAEGKVYFRFSFNGTIPLFECFQDDDNMEFIPYLFFSDNRVKDMEAMF